MGRFTDLRAFGPAPLASTTTLQAAIAGLDGHRDEARALYADALAQWAGAGLPVDRALTAIDMVTVLGPEEPAARAAAEEAREFLQGLRAVRLIDILDRAMAATSGMPHLPATHAVAQEAAPVELAGQET